MKFRQSRINVLRSFPIVHDSETARISRFLRKERSTLRVARGIRERKERRCPRRGENSAEQTVDCNRGPEVRFTYFSRRDSISSVHTPSGYDVTRTTHYTREWVRYSRPAGDDRRRPRRSLVFSVHRRGRDQITTCGRGEGTHSSPSATSRALSGVRPRGAYVAPHHHC